MKIKSKKVKISPLNQKSKKLIINNKPKIIIITLKNNLIFQKIIKMKTKIKKKYSKIILIQPIIIPLKINKIFQTLISKTNLFHNTNKIIIQIIILIKAKPLIWMVNIISNKEFLELVKEIIFKVNKKFLNLIKVKN